MQVSTSTTNRALIAVINTKRGAVFFGSSKPKHSYMLLDGIITEVGESLDDLRKESIEDKLEERVLIYLGDSITITF